MSSSYAVLTRLPRGLPALSAEMLAGVCNATVRSYTRYGKRHGAVVYLLQYTVCVCVCVWCVQCWRGCAAHDKTRTDTIATPARVAQVGGGEFEAPKESSRDRAGVLQDICRNVRRHPCHATPRKQSETPVSLCYFLRHPSVT